MAREQQAKLRNFQAVLNHNTASSGMAKLNTFAKLTNVEQATVVQGLMGVLYNLEDQVVGG